MVLSSKETWSAFLFSNHRIIWFVSLQINCWGLQIFAAASSTVPIPSLSRHPHRLYWAEENGPSLWKLMATYKWYVLTSTNVFDSITSLSSPDFSSNVMNFTWESLSSLPWFVRNATQNYVKFLIVYMFVWNPWVCLYSLQTTYSG